jgi:taurine dioxygenase
LTAEGKLPIRFPHRRGWHTDQSFRRPPPDISLFLAVVPSPRDQGQTLFADGTAAYEALPEDLKALVEDLEGLHVMPGCGRAEQDVRAGKTPDLLMPHERPQRQPVVRVHPVTAKRALYLCEGGQMDWLEGPLVGYEPGPDGEGAALLYRLMHHYTGPDFTYAHHWTKGDLVIYDNRSLIHSATWYDAEAHERVMWRTTVHGNPGPLYDGEKKSWIA